MNETKIISIFLLHYYSFALFFYMLFKLNFLQLNITKDGEEINNGSFKKIYTIAICSSWVVGIPFLIMGTCKNRKF